MPENDVNVEVKFAMGGCQGAGSSENIVVTVFWSAGLGIKFL